MMSLSLRIAVATLALAAGSALAASTVIIGGNYAPGEDIAVNDSMNLGPGTYRFALELSGPADFVDGEVTKWTIYNQFCDPNGDGEIVNCAGDEVPTSPLLEMTAPNIYTALLTVNAPYTIPLSWGPGYENYVDDCCDYRFEFQSANAGQYSFSVTALPEPDRWTMMIIGFGLAGAAMRRRRTVRKTMAVVA